MRRIDRQYDIRGRGAAGLERVQGGAQHACQRSAFRGNGQRLRARRLSCRAHGRVGHAITGFGFRRDEATASLACMGSDVHRARRASVAQARPGSGLRLLRVARRREDRERGAHPRQSPREHSAAVFTHLLRHVRRVARRTRADHASDPHGPARGAPRRPARDSDRAGPPLGGHGAPNVTPQRMPRPGETSGGAGGSSGRAMRSAL